MSGQDVMLVTLAAGAVVIVSRDILVFGMSWWKRDKFTSLFLMSLGATGFGAFTMLINHLVQYGDVIL
ncbi:hypothetical protein VPHD507_0095 [Vibrio phage D507]